MNYATENYFSEKYADMTDEELIKIIRNGDSYAQDFLINKYKGVVRGKARSYFIIGADKDDLIQEGMIGLYKAIRDYQEDRLVPFYAFAEICITRQIITAIKAATRQKHMPLNSYISLNRNAFEEDSDKAYIDLVVESKISNPEDLFIGQEERNFIESYMNETLSKYECKVLSLYLQGKSYYDIASVTNRDAKSIDNALQRVKRKIEKALKQNDAVKLQKHYK